MTGRQEEHTAFILAEEEQCGGSGANAAVDLRLLEAPFPVDAIGLVGDDAEGRLLLAICDSSGSAESSSARLPICRTSHTFVMTARPTGDGPSSTFKARMRC